MNTPTPLRLCIFDLDGTLIDSFRDIADAINGTLAALGRDAIAHEQIKQYIGRGARWLLARCLEAAGLDPEADLQRAREYFFPLYQAGLTNHTTLYPGVQETLQTLQTQGIALALCTNKPIDLTLPLLDKLNMGRWFQLVLGGDSLPVKKPDPGPLLHVMKTLGYTPDETIMVGDSPFDIDAGKAAGARTCGVTYGQYNAAQMQRLAPDWLIHQCVELLSCFPKVASSNLTDTNQSIEIKRFP